MKTVLGIDVGLAPTKRSWAISSLSLSGRGISCETPTFVATGADAQAYLRQLDSKSITSVGFDAPVTPQVLNGIPPTGRAVDARFSRGAFNNFHLGPQPSSIATLLGWNLYLAGMALKGLLSDLGWPVHGFGQPVLAKQSFEVIPKLTMSLMTPPSWTALERPRHGFLHQLDNFLFDRAFNQDAWTGKELLTAFYYGLPIDSSLVEELQRVGGHHPLSERHELIGGLVAGLQTIQFLAGQAQEVGVAGPFEGYYLLPRSWHPEWEAVWAGTMRNGDVVFRSDLGV
jgi:hypothetical protein